MTAIAGHGRPEHGVLVLGRVHVALGQLKAAATIRQEHKRVAGAVAGVLVQVKDLIAAAHQVKVAVTAGPGTEHVIPQTEHGAIGVAAKGKAHVAPAVLAGVAAAGQLHVQAHAPGEAVQVKPLSVAVHLHKVAVTVARRREHAIPLMGRGTAGIPVRAKVAVRVKSQAAALMETRLVLLLALGVAVLKRLRIVMLH